VKTHAFSANPRTISAAELNQMLQAYK
jgi:hypothetical protein